MKARHIVLSFFALLTSITALAEEWTDANGTVWYFTTYWDKYAELEDDLCIGGYVPASLTIPSIVYVGETPYIVTGISSSLEGCSGVTSITIPEGVRIYSTGAFGGCKNLMSVYLMNRNTNYDYNLLKYRRANITLYVRAGRKSAFEADDNWSGFKEIVEMESTPEDNIVTDLYAGNLSNIVGTHVTELKVSGSINAKDINCLRSLTNEHSLTNIDLSEARICRSLQEGDEYTVGANSYALWDNEFGAYIFYQCPNLTTIKIPTTVTSIGDFAFQFCTNLNTLIIPEGVTTIGRNAFAVCPSLSSITIPASVTNIGNYAFDNDGLVSMSVASGNITYDSRNDCNAIIETTTNKLIAGCKNTVIPSDVASIGESAFYKCNGLTSVTIPNSVTIIGNDAFGFCSSLKEIYCLAEVTPDVGSFVSYVFRGVNVSEVMLVVPDDAVEQYKAHPVWGQFHIETPTSVVSHIGEEKEGTIYNLAGQRLGKPTKGVNIQNGRKVVVK